MTIYPRFPSFLGQAWCFLVSWLTVLLRRKVLCGTSLQPTSRLRHYAKRPIKSKSTLFKWLWVENNSHAHEKRVTSAQVIIQALTQLISLHFECAFTSYHYTSYFFDSKLLRWIDFDNALDHTIWNIVTALLNSALDQWPPP